MLKLINGNSYYTELLKTIRNNHYYNTEKSKENYYNYFFGEYLSKLEIEDTDWNHRVFISTNPLDNTILGMVYYCMDRSVNYAYRFGIISFYKDERNKLIQNNGFIFCKDMLQVLDDIFMLYNHNKINCTVYKGNPIEKQYDKILVDTLGGRVVGMYYNDVKLKNGEIVNVKAYELSQENYILNKNKLIKGIRKNG